MKLRRLLALPAVLALAAAGCGDGGGDSAGAGDAGTTSTSVQLESTVVVAGSGGGLGAAYKKALEKFTAKHGVQVQWVEGLATDHLGRLAARRNNPEIDLFQGELVSHWTGAGQGLWQPLDPSRVPNLKELPEDASLPDRTAVLPVIDAVGIVYNREKYAAAGIEPPKDFTDLLNGPPALKEHVAFPHIDNGYMRSYIAVRAAQLKVPVDDPKKVFEELEAADDVIYEYPRTPAEMAQLFANGQVWAGVNGFSRFNEMKTNGLPVEFVGPRETPITPLSWSFVKGAPHPNAAQALVDWLLSPEGQVEVATTTRYSPVLDVELPDDVRNAVMSKEQLDRVTPWDYRTVTASLQTWRNLFAQHLGGGS